MKSLRVIRQFDQFSKKPSGQERSSNDLVESPSALSADMDPTSTNSLAKFPEENPYPVLRVSKAGVLLYANKASRELLEAMNGGVGESLPLDWCAVINNSFHANRANEVELEYRHRVIAFIITPVINEGYVNIYGRDVTEQRDLSESVKGKTEALAESNQKLLRQEKVMHSMMEDLHDSLQQLESQGRSLRAANKKLENSGVLKDEFVAKVSHELRTPLTSIKEGLSLIRDNALGDTTDDQQDFLKTMEEDVERLAELINNMLDIAKIEAGRMRLERKHLKAKDLVSTTIKRYRTLIAKRTITEVVEGSAAIYGDFNRLLQVMCNLLSNAIKYTPAEGSIIFRVNQLDDHVSIEIKDSGPGISEEDLPKLFQKFSQVGSKEAGSLRGTGLGLAVSKELVELHGGCIQVASKVGKGTTFSVIIPTYSDDLALKENFNEMMEYVKQDDENIIGMIAVNKTDQGITEKPNKIESNGLQASQDLAKRISGILHRGDLVLPLESGGVAILAVAQPDGFKAIIKRIEGELSEEFTLKFGTALLHRDGETIEDLSRKAFNDVKAGRRYITETQSDQISEKDNNDNI